MSEEELRRFLGDIKANVDNTVAQLPKHEVYIGQYAKAAPP